MIEIIMFAMVLFPNDDRIEDDTTVNISNVIDENNDVYASEDDTEVVSENDEDTPVGYYAIEDTTNDNEDTPIVDDHIDYVQIVVDDHMIVTIDDAIIRNSCMFLNDPSDINFRNREEFRDIDDYVAIDYNNNLIANDTTNNVHDYSDLTTVDRFSVKNSPSPELPSDIWIDIMMILVDQGPRWVDLAKLVLSAKFLLSEFRSRCQQKLLIVNRFCLGSCYPSQMLNHQFLSESMLMRFGKRHDSTIVLNEAKGLVRKVKDFSLFVKYSFMRLHDEKQLAFREEMYKKCNWRRVTTGFGQCTWIPEHCLFDELLLSGKIDGDSFYLSYQFSSDDDEEISDSESSESSTDSHEPDYEPREDYDLRDIAGY